MLNSDNITLKDLYEEIIKSKNELKNIIEASETRSLLKIHQAQSKIKELERENQKLKEEVEGLKKKINKKREILKNCYKLKGKDITIAHDLTQEQREESKILRKHLLLAKQDKQKNCFIKQNKLFVDGKAYYAKDLLELKEQGNSSEEEESKSAPSTPSQEPRSSEPTVKANKNNPQTLKTITNTNKPVTRNQLTLTNDPKSTLANRPRVKSQN